ncbi:MAG: FadR/GntR family transcriptional regulator [Clostridia bacterium]
MEEGNRNKKKLYFQVYEAIRNLILEEGLRPGDRLPTEMEMTKAFGVSRNVIREAMKTLEIIGVVTSKPGLGMVLNEFNSTFLSNSMFLNLIGDGGSMLDQSHDVRRVLEMGFSKQAFLTITDKDIVELETLVEQMKNCKIDNTNLYEIDSQFHRSMFKNLGNDILIAFIDSAWTCDKFYKSKLIENVMLTVDKHQRIVDALKAKDYEKFYEALNYHFTFNFKTIIQ